MQSMGGALADHVQTKAEQILHYQRICVSASAQLRRFAEGGTVSTMARRRRELWQYAQERWPLLHNLIACHFHEDFNLDYGSLDRAMNAAVSGGSVEHRKAVLKEWREWNASEGAVDDIRPFLHDGFGVAVLLKKPIDGRNFMNRIYDGLIEGVRAETGRRSE